MPSHYLPIRRTRGFRGDLTASPDPLRSFFRLALCPPPFTTIHPPWQALFFQKADFNSLKSPASQNEASFCLVARCFF